MSDKKITYERLAEAVKAVGIAVIAVALAFGLVSAPTETPADDNQPTARGVTNFDSLTLSDDLVVGGDSSVTGALDVDGAVTFGSGALYPLLINDSSEGIYAASALVTGTAVLNTSNHGFSSVTAAFCTLGSTPGTGAGAPALCWASVSGVTVTITVEQDDWTTNATVSGTVNYAVLGTP